MLIEPQTATPELKFYFAEGRTPYFDVIVTLTEEYGYVAKVVYGAVMRSRKWTFFEGKGSISVEAALQKLLEITMVKLGEYEHGDHFYGPGTVQKIIDGLFWDGTIVHDMMQK